MSADPPVARFLILLGLGFFFGLAFEELYAHGRRLHPGGAALWRAGRLP